MKRSTPTQTRDHAINEKAVTDVANWLRVSGIQNQGGRARLAGGVAAWYEISPRRYPFLYSEITGYLITTCMFMHRIRPDRAWARSAERAADWLVRNAFHSSGGVRTRYYLVKNYRTPNYSFHAGRIYAFDTAMAGYGLIQLYRVQPQAVYWKWISKTHDFLMETLQTTRREMPYPYWDSRIRRPGQERDKWSDQRGSFHAKLALYLIDYFRMTGHPDHRAEAVKLLDAIASAQEPGGRFVTGQKDRSTHLHPHLYTLEGLLYGALYLREPKYVRSVLKGMRWLRRAISESGSVSAIYEPVVRGRGATGFAHHERSDIVAQVLRIGSILEGWGINRGAISRRTLKKIRDHLLMFQFSEDGSQNGGFLYGADTDGRLRIHLNAWASMFSLQAIWMYDQFVLRRRPVSMECFV